MGDVIARGAKAEDIFADVATTLLRAQARGGKWQAVAEGQLGDIARLIGETKARREAAVKALDERRAAAGAGMERAVRVVGKVADDVWNAVGRPLSDAALSVLFPGGIAYYTGGARSERAHRMELLASLLESRLHPKLAADVGAAAAALVRQEAAKLRATGDPESVAVAEVRLNGRMKTALARTAQIGLANLKRRYKSEGYSEAEIHSVIPDRPRVIAAPVAEPRPAPQLPQPAPVPSLPPVPGQPVS